MKSLTYFSISFAIFIATYCLLAYLVLVNIRHKYRRDVQDYFGNTSILVVAHPDDETMFFGPTIISIIRASKFLVILCLSTGNAEGLGDERRKELALVVKALGPNVQLKLLDDPSLRDNMITEWNYTHVAEAIEEQIINYESPISTLISFDSNGVSGHTNHKSTSKAIKYIQKRASVPHINIFALKSLPLWRKYTSFLDSLISYLLKDNHLTLALNMEEYSFLKQVLKIHSSQMVWFRYLYMTFSRYMFLNDIEQLA